MTLTRPLFAIAALCLLAQAGCGPPTLHETKDWTLDGGEIQYLVLPAVSKPQTITVEFSTSSGEVDVLLYKSSDIKGETDMLNAAADKALGSKMRSKGDTFKVEVPADTATRLIVRPVKGKAVVKVTVTNQK